MRFYGFYAIYVNNFSLKKEIFEYSGYVELRLLATAYCSQKIIKIH